MRRRGGSDGAAIFPRDRPVVDDDFATVGGDHYNVVFDYATMGDGCFNMVVDMRHRGRRLPRRTTPPRPAAWTTTVPASCRPSAAAVVFDNYATTAGCLDNYSAQLRHHGRLLGQLQCRLRVGRRRRRWCSTTTPLPPPSTAGRPAACTATRPPQRRQPQQRPVRPRVHRSGGNHNNAHHSHSAVNGGVYNTAHDQDSTMDSCGEDGFGTIASDTVYGCAATIGGSTYTTDGQLVQRRPDRLLDVRRWFHQPGRTAPRSPAAAPTATGTPATLQSARATPPPRGLHCVRFAGAATVGEARRRWCGRARCVSVHSIGRTRLTVQRGCVQP